MERGSRILVFLAIFGLLYFAFTSFGNGGDKELQPITPTEIVADEPRAPETTCDVWTERFRATISSRGGSVKSFQPLTAKYKKEGQQLDLVTTPDHPHLSPLFVQFRNPVAQVSDDEGLVGADLLDFEVESSSGKDCVLVHETDELRIEKKFVAGNTPYTIELKVTVENRAQASHTYALTASTAAYLLDDEVESEMFRMNPRMTHVECLGPGETVERMSPDDFEPDDFEEKELFSKTQLNNGEWASPLAASTLAAVSNAYFTNAIAHDGGPVDPVCHLQIEERWNSGQFDSKSKDPDSAAIYKARLAYEPRKLEPGASDTYEFRAFVGPKERNALQAAGERFTPLIDLGFFSIIAKVLVAFLLRVHDVVPSWGIAIVILTFTARFLLFPLTWPSIKNMVHMRELKPEMDKLTAKYKDDPQARGLAQMELWKKHGVNPMKGCLPQLASMPVWFALYTTLQTAVELYNIPFLWFPDLSEPDPYYILPFVIGGVFFLQQKLMPMQADPAQQKMLMYFMPTMFTVFMLFLPAGLGVYMFTNSLLGIAQQQVVELHAKKHLAERRAKLAPEEEERPSTTKRKKSTKRS